MKLPHKPGDPDYLLRRVLQANATFSTVCGLVWVGGGASLGTWFGRDGSMAADGAGLLIFAALLVSLSLRRSIPTVLAAVIVALDILWVVDAGVKIADGAFSTPGAWVMGAIALVVLDFATFQALGAYRSRKMRRPAAA